jgi:hypothetical protein
MRILFKVVRVMNMLKALKAIEAVPSFHRRESSARTGKNERRLDISSLVKANPGKFNAPQIALEMDVVASTVNTDIKAIGNIFKRPCGGCYWVNL